MAPKRKATPPAPKAQTAKRTTKASTSTTNTSSTSKAAVKKAPVKKTKAIVLSSDEEDSDNDVIIESPKKVTKSAVKKTPAVKKAPVKKATTSKAKVSTNPEPASTSTTPLPETPASIPKKVIVKAPVVPKRILTWEESTQEWFSQFEDESEKGTMAGEGVERLFTDMGVEMEGPLPFILAWKLGSKPGSFGSFYLQDFLNNYSFRANKISTSAALKTHLSSIEKTLFPTSDQEKLMSQVEYKRFYSFLFNFLKPEGQKSLQGEMASAVWSVILSPRSAIGKEFVDFTVELGPAFKGVSMDVWSQLLEFCCTVDTDLNGFNEEDAWPAVLDEFVEYKRAKLT